MNAKSKRGSRVSPAGLESRPPADRWRFGHSRTALRFWRDLVEEALPLLPSPFYLFSVEPIKDRLQQLDEFARQMPLPVRHWLSCKTQPVQPLLQWWRRRGAGIEVVSEFEFQAALREGFAPEQILVNGPAKHRWLPHYPVVGARVNFDSEAEIEALLPLARRLKWSLGVRCHTEGECGRKLDDPAQFGLDFPEAIHALRRLRRARVRMETVHFHYGTQVKSPELYAEALSEVALICKAAGFAPKHLDCGGGWPAANVLSYDQRAYDAQFRLVDMAKMYSKAIDSFPKLREVWFENGRFLTAPSGVLVLRVLDIKAPGSIRQLICDGGRTGHALISMWEAHHLFSVPQRAGRVCLTSVYGPTCMAFDELARRPMPRDIQAGDHLVWMDAGAYHIPWETRFSHGQAGVLWHEDHKIRVARRPETFEAWWGAWSRAD